MWCSHPRVFLDLSETGNASCPYCGTKYQLKAGEKLGLDGELVSDIRSYEIIEDDKILITFGGETDEQIQEYLKQLDIQEIRK